LEGRHRSSSTRPTQELSDAELLAIASKDARRLEVAVTCADDVDGAARLLQAAGVEFEKAELTAIDPMRALATLEAFGRSNGEMQDWCDREKSC